MAGKFAITEDVPAQEQFFWYDGDRVNKLVEEGSNVLLLSFLPRAVYRIGWTRIELTLGIGVKLFDETIIWMSL